MEYSNNYSKEEQKKLAKQKVEKALSKIGTDVISVFDNNRFPEYLSFAANFHYYDVNNTLLIYKQRPSATFLASFKAWEKFSLDNWGEANRPVFISSQKGKGIGILAPYVLKKKSSGSEDNKEQRGRVLSYLDYHVVFVFDKEQTNDIPIPVMSWDLSKSSSDCEALFYAFKEKAPFNIVFSGSGDVSYNYTYETADSSGSRDSLILNYKDRNDFYSLCSYIVKTFAVQSLKHLQNRYSKDEFQKICECVAYMISSYFGLPTEQYVFFFVKLWGGNNPNKMIDILNIIQTAAHYLIDLIEEEMIFYKNMYDDNDVYDNNDIFEFNSVFDF